MKLKSFEVESIDNDILPEKYLPLKIGNKWSYKAYNSNDTPYSESYDYENLFEVVCFREYDNAAMIAHSGWSCPIKK